MVVVGGELRENVDSWGLSCLKRFDPQNGGGGVAMPLQRKCTPWRVQLSVHRQRTSKCLYNLLKLRPQMTNDTLLKLLCKEGPVSTDWRLLAAVSRTSIECANA